jgi:hypothetical protein
MNKEHIYFPFLDNGMGLSRTSWAMAMCDACLTILRDFKVTMEGISYPYPDGAMNIATDHFMETEAQSMVVIDTDVIFSLQDLACLLSHGDEPFVAGLYPKKVPGLVFPACPIEGQEHVFADDGRPFLREIACVARGFVKIHRSVFEAMKPHCVTDIHVATGKPLTAYWKGLHGGHSEDFDFCNRYRAIGGRIMLDTRICAKHEGSAVYPIPGTYPEPNSKEEAA